LKTQFSKFIKIPKKILGFFISLMLILQVSCLKNEAERNGISTLLPRNEDMDNWETKNEPLYCVGEDLYELINGGAEIYHEYGFKEIISQEYESLNGKSINLEIYKMENSVSAFGIYSFKTSSDGKKIDIGNEALLEDYYLNFWKGEYLITLVGFDTKKETLDGILDLAKIINEKITSVGHKPVLVDMLTLETGSPLQVKYLKGNLALFNNYEFDSQNIFGVTEGVIGKYENFRIFLFNYDNEATSLKWFKNAIIKLTKNSRFKIINYIENTISILDERDNIIYIEPFENFILVFMEKNEFKNITVLNEVKRKINQSKKMIGDDS
jgi:hypothetical protein